MMTIDLYNAEVQTFKYKSHLETKEKPAKHLLNPDCDPANAVKIREEIKKIKSTTILTRDDDS